MQKSDKSAEERILDPDDYSNVFLCDGKGNEIEFEQIAVIPLNDNVYCILLPTDPQAIGVKEDEAVMFSVLPFVSVVTDDDIFDAIIIEYQKLLEDSGLW